MSELTPAMKDRMKKAFNECYRAVLNASDETGRKRSELFKELVSKKVRKDLARVT